MKAILRCSTCLQDDRDVFRVLAENNVNILKTKNRGCNTYAEITILVNDRQELNKLLYKLNCACTYGVSVVRTSEIYNKKAKCPSRTLRQKQ